MTEPEIGLHRKVVYTGARFVASLLVIASVAGAVGLAVHPAPDMDTGMRWGLFGLMVVILIVSVLTLFAPISRRKRDAR
jgi:hypothetical protein